MLTAYLTHDPVNAATAEDVAAWAGVALLILDARDTATIASADRVVLDLDFLPPEFKARLLEKARRGEELAWVGTHSYQLTADEILLLRLAGATFRRVLTVGLFQTVPATVE